MVIDFGFDNFNVMNLSNSEAVSGDWKLCCCRSDSVFSSIFRSDAEETVEETKRAKDEPPEIGLENAEPFDVLFTIV